MAEKVVIYILLSVGRSVTVLGKKIGDGMGSVCECVYFARLRRLAFCMRYMYIF